MPIKVLIPHVGIKDLTARIKEKYTVNQPIRGQYFFVGMELTLERPKGGMGGGGGGFGPKI